MDARFHFWARFLRALGGVQRYALVWLCIGECTPPSCDGPLAKPSECKFPFDRLMIGSRSAQRLAHLRSREESRRWDQEGGEQGVGIFEVRWFDH